MAKNKLAIVFSWTVIFSFVIANCWPNLSTYVVWPMGWSGLGLMLLAGKIRHFSLLVPAGLLLVMAISFVRSDLLQSTEIWLPAKQINLIGVVDSWPEPRGLNQQFILRPIAPPELSGKIMFRLPAWPALSYGQKISATTTLSLPEDFIGVNRQPVSYQQYLLSRGVTYLGQADTASILAEAPMSYHVCLFRLRQRGLSALAASLAEPANALAGGLLFGTNQGLSQDWQNDFSAVGLSHILVASGYNVALVVLFIWFLLANCSYRWRYFFAMLGAISFAILVGGDGAVIRATIFCLLVLSAKMIGRPINYFLLLSYLLVIMLWWRPSLVFANLGFQLSLLATLGIIYLSPALEKIFRRFLSGPLAKILAVSTAAQLAVGPWLAYRLGSISLIALVANPLLLPLVPWLMFNALIAGGVYLWWPSLGLVLAYPAHLPAQLLMSGVEILAQLPHGHWLGVSVSWPVVGLLYFLLWLVWWYLSKYQKLC